MENQEIQIQNLAQSIESFRAGQQYVQENDHLINMQNEIRYMRKLYFMMFLQSIIVFVALLVKSLILIKEKGVSTLEQFKKSLLNHNFGLWFSILVCLLLSLISNRSIAKLKSPVNIFIWLAFVLSLSILFCYLNVLHENCSFLILSLISAQILAQLISVNSIKVDLTIQQSTFSILISSLIVFQLFIIYTSIPFTSMVFLLINGIVFGFILVYTVVYEPKSTDQDSVLGSVGIYTQMMEIFLRIPMLLRPTIIKKRKD